MCLTYRRLPAAVKYKTMSQNRRDTKTITVQIHFIFYSSAPPPLLCAFSLTAGGEEGGGGGGIGGPRHYWMPLNKHMANTMAKSCRDTTHLDEKHEVINESAFYKRRARTSMVSTTMAKAPAV